MCEGRRVRGRRGCCPRGWHGGAAIRHGGPGPASIVVCVPAARQWTPPAPAKRRADCGRRAPDARPLRGMAAQHAPTATLPATSCHERRGDATSERVDVARSDVETVETLGRGRGHTPNAKAITYHGAEARLLRSRSRFRTRPRAAYVYGIRPPRVRGRGRARAGAICPCAAAAPPPDAKREKGEGGRRRGGQAAGAWRDAGSRACVRGKKPLRRTARADGRATGRSCGWLARSRSRVGKHASGQHVPPSPPRAAPRREPTPTHAPDRAPAPWEPPPRLLPRAVARVFCARPRFPACPLSLSSPPLRCCTPRGTGTGPHAKPATARDRDRGPGIRSSMTSSARPPAGGGGRKGLASESDRGQTAPARRDHHRRRTRTFSVPAPVRVRVRVEGAGACVPTRPGASVPPNLRAGAGS